jgi:hypothetical protein
MRVSYCSLAMTIPPCSVGRTSTISSFIYLLLLHPLVDNDAREDEEDYKYPHHRYISPEVPALIEVNVCAHYFFFSQGGSFFSSLPFSFLASAFPLAV